jgi:hypothetical protein
MRVLLLRDAAQGARAGCGVPASGAWRLRRLLRVRRYLSRKAGPRSAATRRRPRCDAPLHCGTPDASACAAATRLEALVQDEAAERDDQRSNGGARAPKGAHRLGAPGGHAGPEVLEHLRGARA